MFRVGDHLALRPSFLSSRKPIEQRDDADENRDATHDDKKSGHWRSALAIESVMAMSTIQITKPVRADQAEKGRYRVGSISTVDAKLLPASVRMPRSKVANTPLR